MDDIESVITSILNSQDPELRLESINDILTEANLWSILASVDDSFFPPPLFAEYVFSFDSIIRLMVEYAYSVCKMTVNTRYSCNLIADRIPENVAKFVLFLAVHSEKRQLIVEAILQMSESAQHEAMLAIETTRKQVMENDVAEVLAKISHYESLLQQETKKVHEKQEEISKLTSQLQTVANANKDLKKRVSIMEQEQREAVDELDVSSLDAVVHIHRKTMQQRDEYQKQMKEKDEELEFLKERYHDAITKIQDLQDDLSNLKENRQSCMETRESFSHALKETQQSEMFKKVQRMSMRQDNMRLEIMHAKKTSQKEKLRADQRSEQLAELFKHLKIFERKVKKIKTERNPELDSMIRSQTNMS